MATITRTVLDESPLAVVEASDNGGVDITLFNAFWGVTRNLSATEAREVAGELVKAAADADTYRTEQHTSGESA